MLQDLGLWRTVAPLLQSLIDGQVAQDVVCHLTDLGFGSPRRTVLMICADLLSLLVTVSCYMALVPDPVSKDLELEGISPAVGFTAVAGKGSSFSKAYATEEGATGGDGVNTEKVQGDFYIIGKQIYDETEQKQSNFATVGWTEPTHAEAQTKNKIVQRGTRERINLTPEIKGYRIGYR